MLPSLSPRAVIALLCLAASLVGVRVPASPPRIPDFTFIHCSDVHVPPGVTRRTAPPGAPENAPAYGSAEVIAQIKSLTQPIELRPYGVTVPPPAFAIVTGDLTEFGGLNGWWDQYLALWQGAPFPVYHQSGNHDSTWACQRFRIRQLHGGPYYSFDRFGCHFIGWDSATPQDPRPSFGQEGIEWLKQDLRQVRPETPIFLFCHHPLDSREFASPYERDRLLDILRPYNLVLLLVGHGHAATHSVVGGTDQVMGGSTFGGAPGYSVVSVKDGVLRVAYRTAWRDAPDRPLLQKPLPAGPDAPSIRILAPQEGATVSPVQFRLRATIDRHAERARWQADDEAPRSGELRRSGGAWEARIDTRDWEAGAHYIRVTFEIGGRAWSRTVRVYRSSPRRQPPRLLWRASMAGSGKGSPAVSGSLVVAGAGDGCLYAFDRRTGERRWRVRTGGEILAPPLAWGDAFYVGSGDGLFYAIDRKGQIRWTFPAGYPIYSAAVAVENRILFAANDGRIFALDPDTGQKLWEGRAPKYAIESRPFAWNGIVYWGAWDGYVYAYRARDGALLWTAQGAGSAASLPGVARYYSPADAGPVVAGGKVWVADRMYRLTLLDAVTGSVLGSQTGVSSVGLSERGDAVYLRGTDGYLRKVTPDGAEIWRVPARTGAVPTAPQEADGVVYTVSGTGRLLALDAGTGTLLWEYQVTPRLYVFADPVAAGGVVYLPGMDGSLTALRGR